MVQGGGHYVNMQVNNDQVLLTPKQLAERLQLPIQTLYGWRHRGVGPTAIRVGKHTRYRGAEVERWLDEQSSTSSRR